MQIYVNEQELDAELDGERNLQEIYDAVGGWIADHKRYILGLQADGEDVPISSLGEIELEAVERLDFYVGDELDMVLATIGELDRYVDQIGATMYELQSLNADDSENLGEGLAWIRQILESFATIMKLDVAGMNVLTPGAEGSEAVDRILERLDKRARLFAKDEANNRESIELFLEDLRSFKFFVMKLNLQLRTMNARTEDLAELVGQFEDKIPELTDEIVSINESFGAGKDFAALETLDRITAELNEYVSALYALDYQMRRRREKASAGDADGIQGVQVDGEGASFHSVAAEITGMLRDLSNALEEQDIVAVGDILEYELTEKLRDLKPYLTEIRQFVLATR